MRDTLASTVGYWGRQNPHRELREPAAKRISTPAGQRLSVILGAGDPEKAARSAAHRQSLRTSGLPAELGDTPRESREDASDNSYTTTVWSDTEKWSLKGSRNWARRIGWKKIAIVLAIVIAGIIAVVVGVVVGTKKPSSGNNSDSDSQSSMNPELSNEIPDAEDKPAPTGTLAPPAATPSNFPAGSYSFVTFLDTVITECTANPATWTCDPGTIFNDDPVDAVATFNWEISSTSGGKYTISSTGTGMSFKDVDLELVGEGTDAERYRFQFTDTKKVTPSASITEDGDEVECEYGSTSFNAFLYTKMARSYPDMEKGQPSGDPKFDVWPYAVRVEQSAAGGQNVPSCHKMSNGQAGAQINEGLPAQSASGLCSCLYKNWRTPGNY